MNARELVDEKLKRMGQSPPEPVRAQMAVDLKARMDDRVKNAIIDAIPDHLAKESFEALEAGTWYEWLKDHLPNLSDIIGQAREDFEREYLPEPQKKGGMFGLFKRS